MAQRHRLSALRTACLAIVVVIYFFAAISTVAQTPPPRLYASGTSLLTSFSPNSDGSLNPSAAPPYAATPFQGGPMAIDGLGHFLFVINTSTNALWMFPIQSDGSLGQPPTPFAAATPGSTETPPSNPVSLATEASGRFLYVGYETTNIPGYGAIVAFQINAAALQIVPLTSQLNYLQASPIAMSANSNGTFLYVGLYGTGSDRGTNVYEINPDGTLDLASSDASANAYERSIAIDPQGHFLIDGWGSEQGFLQSSLISPWDGSLTLVGTPIALGTQNLPRSMLLDNSGKFLYVSGQQGGGSYIYSLDESGNLPPQSPAVVGDLNFQPGAAVADRQGPYLYSLQSDGIHAYVIEPATGAIAHVDASPPLSIGEGAGIGGLAISGSPLQAVSGPAVQLFPPSFTFNSTTEGQTSNQQEIMSVTNTGSVPVSIQGISVTGSGAGSFPATPSCSLSATLPAGTSSESTCTITVSFAPMTAGSQQATLSVATSAGTQTAQLSGTGIAATSGVTLTPSGLMFPGTLQGATSSAQTVQLTSTGPAPLHISSVLLSGANPSDFTIAPGGCSTATYAANSICNITATFSPLGDGARNASIIIADDAPGSTQTVPLSGTGTGAPVPHPAAAITPPALAFSGVAQGATSNLQNITVTSSGTGTLHISSVQLSGANASDFKMTDGCTASGGYVPGQACTISLGFTPSVQGTRFATLTITDDAANSPQTVSISGNSSAPTPSLTVNLYGTSSYSQTVTAGQTASFALQLVSNFNGTASFSTCTGAPTSATCTVPTPMSVTSGKGTPFSITIATTATAASSTRPAQFESSQRIALASFFSVLLLLFHSVRASSNRPHGLRRPCAAFDQISLSHALCLAAILVIATSALSGCGGASTVAQSLPVTTPTQTYTIVVQPSATTADNIPVTGIPPIQLTLTVD
jgi:hypothetical protein